MNRDNLHLKRNSTHTQIRVEGFDVGSEEVTITLEYKGFYPVLMKRIVGSEYFCLDWVNKKEVNNDGYKTYKDFLSFTNKVGYTFSPEEEEYLNNKGDSEMPDNGFCNFMFGVMEKDFRITDFNKNYKIKQNNYPIDFELSSLTWIRDKGHYANWHSFLKGPSNNTIVIGKTTEPLPSNFFITFRTGFISDEYPIQRKLILENKKIKIQIQTETIFCVSVINIIMVFFLIIRKKMDNRSVENSSVLH